MGRCLERAEDFVPETQTKAERINRWIDEDDPKPGSIAERFVGKARFEFQGVSISSAAPYRFYLLQKIQDAYAGLSEGEKYDVLELLEELGLTSVLSVTIDRKVKRHNHQEVWV